MQLKINGAPHTKTNLKTAGIMKHVILSLLPAIAAGIYFFGLRAAILVITCTLTAVITEEALTRLRGQSGKTRDYSAAVTGILTALILPPSINLYAAILGTVSAVLVGKHLFGGLGFNIFNPALLGRAFLVAAYPKMLTTYILPGQSDTVTEATPLMLQKFSQESTPLAKLFWGNVAGSLGETSAICLILGGLYLLVRRIADWRIPAAIAVSVALASGIGYWFNPSLGSPLFHFLSGGLLLGLFFMATDPVTTPVTKKGRYIFGIGCGLLIMIIRYFSNLPEGVMYSILFMNAFVPLLNRYARPKSFGR